MVVCEWFSIQAALAEKQVFRTKFLKCLHMGVQDFSYSWCETEVEDGVFYELAKKLFSRGLCLIGMWGVARCAGDREGVEVLNQHRRCASTNL